MLDIETKEKYSFSFTPPYEGIDVDIELNKYIFVVGLNGSGKSFLLSELAKSLNKNQIGYINFDGIGHGLGTDFFKSLTKKEEKIILENLPEAIKANIAETDKRFEYNRTLENIYKMFGNGHKKLFEMYALASININAEYFLLDMPESYIDIKAQYNLITKLSKKFDHLSFVIVTHSQSIIAGYYRPTDEITMYEL
jgi:ABC-type cobalamin/Fe3+-siderophores transport system ATPase subunit